MTQKEVIAQLKSLRLSQAAFVGTSDDEIFARDVEALDAAIATLERIRWRKVTEEIPEKNGDEFFCVLKFVAMGDERYYVSATGYYPDLKNPWCEAKGTRTTHWAYLPELPEMSEEEDHD